MFRWPRGRHRSRPNASELLRRHRDARPSAVRLREMTRRELTWSYLDQRRDLPMTPLKRQRAACVEHAAGRWGKRAGQLAVKHDAVTTSLHAGVGHGHSCEKRLRIRMVWLLEDLLGPRNLHD